MTYDDLTAALLRLPVDWSRPVETMFGAPVRIFTVDRAGGPPVVGTVQRQDGFEVLSVWHASGRHSWTAAETAISPDRPHPVVRMSERQFDLRNVVDGER